MKDILDVITIALGPCDVIDSRDSRMCVLRVLSSLTPRESTIVILRCTGMTLHEVGVNLGLTGERIRQIEAKAYKKLRHPLRSQKFKEFIRKEMHHETNLR